MRFDIPPREPPRPFHGVLAAVFVATVALSAIIGAEKARSDGPPNGPSVLSQERSLSGRLS